MREASKETKSQGKVSTDIILVMCFRVISKREKRMDQGKCSLQTEIAMRECGRVG